ncbi:MAG: 4a-hydroxytetrahydrobiopterin dehydratase [Verrucomicrobia bacterium]|nr:4a-hydroxytetrahydrobiopterin dehydratase [Verrucomicrobiota bacterium]
MSELAKKKCVPCTVGTPPLKGKELQAFFNELEEGWRLIEESRLEKSYKFKDFKGALAFVNDLGKIAEEQGHHPDIELSWGKVKVVLWTHKIHGLSESDFVMAAKCDVAFTSRVK